MRAYEILTESRSANLYHGTGVAALLGILRADTLRGSKDYDDDPYGVSLSRSYRVAQSFQGRDGWSGGTGAVLVLDQQRLVQNHKIAPFASVDSEGAYMDREDEEVVLGDIKPLSRYLLSINIEPRLFKMLYHPTDFYRWWESTGRDYSGIDDDDQGRESLLALRHHPLLNKISPRNAEPVEEYKPFTKLEEVGIKFFKQHGLKIVVANQPFAGERWDQVDGVNEYYPVSISDAIRSLIYKGYIQRTGDQQQSIYTPGPRWKDVK